MPRLSLPVGRGAAAIAILLPVLATAQDRNDAAVQANNPLANVSAFNIHNYYIGDLTEIDRPGNQTWLRYARPLQIGRSNWLTRTSLPLNGYPTLDASGDRGREFGLGDLNAFATYVIDTGNPALSFGIGPQITIPTATDDALGAGKWSLGLSNVLFNASSKVFQWGYLLGWQASVAGDDNRDDVNLGTFQPFLMYQLGQGWYLRSTGTWSYDFEHDYYAIPIGLGVGKVIPTPKVTYNAFIEPQYSVDTKGPGQPEWQIFAGFNMQFTE